MKNTTLSFTYGIIAVLFHYTMSQLDKHSIHNFDTGVCIGLVGGLAMVFYILSLIKLFQITKCQN